MSTATVAIPPELNRLLRLLNCAFEDYSCPPQCWAEIGVGLTGFDDFDEPEDATWDLPRFRDGCRHELRYLELRDELRRLGQWL